MYYTCHLKKFYTIVLLNFMIYSLYFVPHNLFGGRLKRKKVLTLYIGIKWNFRKKKIILIRFLENKPTISISYSYRILIKFQIKPNI